MDSMKEQKFLEKIFKETKLDKMTWKSLDRNHDVPNNGYIIGKIYRAEINKKLLLLFRYKYQVFYLDLDLLWKESTRLEITDSNYNPEYEIEDQTILYSIYDTVRYKEAKMDDFFNELGI